MKSSLRPPEQHTRSGNGRLGAFVTPIAIALLTLTVYANSLFSGFVWDDFPVLVENPAVLSVANIPSFFVDVGATAAGEALQHYRPIRTSLFALLHHVVGYDAFWYHLLNVILHAANTLLVFAVLRRLGIGSPFAGLLACVFGVHPINTEAVSSVVGLGDLLFAHFYLLGFLFHLKRCEFAADRGRWTAAVYIAFALSLLSKEMAVTFPLVILLHSLLLGDGEPEGRRHGAGDLGYLAGLFSLAAAYVLARGILLGGLGGGEMPGVTFGRTMLMQAVVLTKYAGLILWPLGQSVRHVVSIPETWWSAEHLTALAIVLAILALSVWSLARGRGVGFGFGWFWITLLPVMNIVPLPGAMMGERFLYLPLVGLLIALGSILLESAEAKPRVRVWATAVAAICVVSCSGLTVRRNLAWHDNLTLFESAVQVAPQSNAVRLNLARAYEQAGRQREAVEQLQAGAQNTLQYYELYVRLGQRAESGGRLPEALECYRRALRMDPDAQGVRERVLRLEESLRETDE